MDFHRLKQLSRSAARPLFTWVLSLSAVLLLPACNKGGLSTPKDAAQTFATAVANGDIETAKKASTGGDPGFIQSLATFAANMKKYRDAMASKFGDEGKAAAEGTANSATAIATKLNDGEVKENGDTATITSKMDSKPLTLKKVNGEWKVDLSQTAGLGGALGAGLMDPMGQVAAEMADEVNAGKYSSAKAAQAAFGTRMIGSYSVAPPPG